MVLDPFASGVTGLGMVNMTQITTPAHPPENKFLIPYERNPHFTGRSQFLDTLYAKLSDEREGNYNHKVAIFGLGGIGKTQIAIEYAYRSRSYYERIYWINGADKVALVSGYAKIAGAANIRLQEKASPESVVEVVQLWLQEIQGWLIIFDNVDDITVVQGFVPMVGSREHVLITTRDNNFAGIPAQGMEVPILEPSEAMHLLHVLSDIEISPGATEDEALEIAQAFGYLPLALEQAAAFVREVTGDFHQYWKEYKMNNREVRHWVPSGNRQYEYSLATAWSPSFKILEAHPETKRLLQILAFLSPDAVPIDFLLDGLSIVRGGHASNEFSSPERQLPVDATDISSEESPIMSPADSSGLQSEISNLMSTTIERAMSFLLLSRLSLVKWDRKSGTVSMHRMVQAAVIENIESLERSSILNVLVEICDTAFPEPDDARNLTFCRKYYDQVESVLSHEPKQSPKLGSLYYKVGRYLFGLGYFRLAEENMSNCIKCLSAAGTEFRDKLFGTRWMLANMLLEEVRPTAARKVLQEMPEFSQTLTETEWTPLTESVQHLHFCLLRAEGRYSEVVELALKRLELLKHVEPAKLPGTRNVLNDLGVAYLELKRFKEAAEVFEELVSLYQQEASGEYAVLLMKSRLVRAYCGLGKLDNALEIGLDTLRKSIDMLGEDHLLTLAVMDWVADVDLAQGKYDDCLSLTSRVLEKRLKTTGPEQSDAIVTLFRLCHTYFKTQNWVKFGESGADIFEYGKIILAKDYDHHVFRCLRELAALFDESDDKEKGTEVRSYLNSAEAGGRDRTMEDGSYNRILSSNDILTRYGLLSGVVTRTDDFTGAKDSRVAMCGCLLGLLIYIFWFFT